MGVYTMKKAGRLNDDLLKDFIGYWEWLF